MCMYANHWMVFMCLQIHTHVCVSYYNSKACTHMESAHVNSTAQVSLHEITNRTQCTDTCREAERVQFL